MQACPPSWCTTSAPAYSALWATHAGPLLYLSLGGVVNVALNLFFVLAFDMGVAGRRPIGTVVSQTLAAFLVVR